MAQYLAAGLPIVSTPLPDLDEFSDLVIQARDASSFVASIERALKVPPRVSERRAAAARNTWQARTEAISTVIEAHLAGNPPPSSSDFRG